MTLVIVKEQRSVENLDKPAVFEEFGRSCPLQDGL
jgi:hypothetical protein